MFRLATGFAALALLAPAAASAATLPQAPPKDFSGDEQCVRATGAPGLLAVENANGVRFVHATRAGFTLGERVRLAEAFKCGTTTVRTSGAGVIAGSGPTSSGTTDVLAAVRDPGGAWQAAQKVATVPSTQVSGVRAAVSERG